MRIKHIALRALLVLAMAGLTSNAMAGHSWSVYHWARMTFSFDLRVINSTTSDWHPYVSQAIADWSWSSVLEMKEEIGSTDDNVRRSCNGGSGTMRICNLAYGNNGWLGLAGISIDANSHITSAYTKLNDSYFTWDYYNHPDWKQSVTCQELGHDIGLGHQDVDFNNTSLFSCMDYQVPPYEYPNAHDYDTLEVMYGHPDSYNSYAYASEDGGGGGCNAPPGKGCNKNKKSGANGDVGWGASLGRRGNVETFIRIDPDGTMHLTYVTWAIGF